MGQSTVITHTQSEISEATLRKSVDCALDVGPA